MHLCPRRQATKPFRGRADRGADALNVPGVAVVAAATYGKPRAFARGAHHRASVRHVRADAVAIDAGHHTLVPALRAVLVLRLRLRLAREQVGKPRKPALAGPVPGGRGGRLGGGGDTRGLDAQIGRAGVCGWCGGGGVVSRAVGRRRRDA